MAVSTVKVEHVNPFIKATIETFSSMMAMDIKPGKITLKQGSGISYDVSGIIGLSGEARGSISISFPKVTGLKVVSAFLGEEISELNDDVVDAIGELANIVSGAAKKDLTDFNINISLPSVVFGDGHTVKDPKDVLAFVVPFTCEAGNFDLAVCLKSED